VIGSIADISGPSKKSRQFVFDLAKSDLAYYYYKQSIDGVEEVKKEACKIYNYNNSNDNKKQQQYYFSKRETGDIKTNYSIQ